MSADEPTEQTEESGDEIDNGNGAGKLPTGDGTPEWTVGTSDEDEPVLGEGDFKEQDFIAHTKVLNDTITRNERSSQRNPRTDSENDSKNGGDSPEFGKIPLDGRFTVRSVIISNGKGCDIGKDSNKDNQFQLQTGVKNYDPEAEEYFQMERQRDTVDDVRVHTMENLTGCLEGVDDSRQTRSQEDDIGGGSSSIGGTFDGDTSVCFF